MINDKSSTKKIILGIVILVVLSLVVYFIMLKNSPPIAVQPMASPIITSQPTALEPTQSISSQAVIKQIIIKTGIDVDNPIQYLPYELRTAKGHYLIWVHETNKLIYDGNEIYSGENLNSIALSHNGLHYAYIISNGNTGDFYIDNQKITSASNLYLPAITNDGAHYFYTTQAGILGDTRDTLFKDGKEIFTQNAAILGLWISDEGSSYLTYLTESTGYSLVLNGKEIYKGGELKEKMFSDNGQHYAYITGKFVVAGKFVVDGKTKLEGVNLNFPQLTDSGHYAVTDTNNKKIYIDDKSYDSTSDYGRALINNNVSHYLISDFMNSEIWRLENKEIWKLDGNIISLENTKGGVEIDDNIVYVYGLVK